MKNIKQLTSPFYFSGGGQPRVVVRSGPAPSPQVIVTSGQPQVLVASGNPPVSLPTQPAPQRLVVAAPGSSQPQVIRAGEEIIIRRIRSVTFLQLQEAPW